MYSLGLATLRASEKSVLRDAFVALHLSLSLPYKVDADAPLTPAVWPVLKAIQNSASRFPKMLIARYMITIIKYMHWVNKLHEICIIMSFREFLTTIEYDNFQFHSFKYSSNTPTDTGFHRGDISQTNLRFTKRLFQEMTDTFQR